MLMQEVWHHGSTVDLRIQKVIRRKYECRPAAGICCGLWNMKIELECLNWCNNE